MQTTGSVGLTLARRLGGGRITSAVNFGETV